MEPHSFLSSLLAQTSSPQNKNDSVRHHKQSEKHASNKARLFSGTRAVSPTPGLTDPTTHAESALKIKKKKKKCLRKEERMKGKSFLSPSFRFTATTLLARASSGRWLETMSHTSQWGQKGMCGPEKKRLREIKRTFFQSFQDLSG